MRVSVVICVYDMERYEDLMDAIESIFEQTYSPVEMVLVSDGNETLCERLRADYGGFSDVQIACSDENQGLSASRNLGIDVATGDVIAFMDDDAVADERWIEELISVYRDHDVEAAGGKMTPLWEGERRADIPEEYYWLVGVTHRGFPDEGPVRNTFGSNISFRADVLDELGGFSERLGRKGERLVQGEETELAVRLRTELGGTLYYTPGAQVGHKIFEYRTRPTWLLRRAFWQGYSKQLMEDIIQGTSPDESEFLESLLYEFVPERVRDILKEPSSSNIKQLVYLVLLTAAIGAGYLWGLLRSILHLR